MHFGTQTTPLDDKESISPARHHAAANETNYSADENLLAVMKQLMENFAETFADRNFFIRQLFADMDISLSFHTSAITGIDYIDVLLVFILLLTPWLGSRVVIACWTQAQNGLGSNRSRDAVG